MDILESKRKPFLITDPRQRRIYDRLQSLVDPCAAAFYHDAVELMETRPPYQTLTHTMGHFMREVESALREKLDPLAPRTTSTRKNTSEAHRNQVLRICDALSVSGSEIAGWWLTLCGGENSHSLSMRAHRNSPGPARPLDDEFLGLWEEFQYLLDTVLAAQETVFLKYVSRLDELLAQDTPTDEEVKALKHMPQSAVILGYFFERLDQSTWLPLLKKAHYFDYPPHARHHEEQGIIEYPPWPQARYLARMSSVDPTTVCEIILSMPETDNIWLIYDLIGGICDTPTEYASKLVPRITAWIPSLRGVPCIKELGELGCKLAQGGHPQDALSLFGSLLQVRVSAHRGAFGSTEVEGVIDPHHYEEIVWECLPEVVPQLGKSLFLMLGDLLQQAVTLSASESQLESAEDYSFIWQPKIESDRRHGHGDYRNLLISALRDLSLGTISDATSAHEVVENLEGRRWHVFRRIAFHVLRISNSPIKMIAARLVDKKYFDYLGETEHEYTLLLKDWFGRLSHEDQQAILTWIDEGPELEGFEERRASWSGRSTTQADVEEYVARWRHDRLALIAGHLGEPWLQQYLGLRDRFGNIDGLDSTRPRGMVWTGTLTPKTLDELNAMPVDELVDYLQRWEQTDGIKAPSYEGLAQSLTQSVAASPARFATAAYSFRKLERPEYKAAVLDGFRTASEKGERFPWRAVFNLCKWILENPQPATLIRRSGKETVQEPYDSERYSIASLIEKALSGKNRPRYTLRKDAWAIIESLMRNPGERKHSREDGLSPSSLSSTWCTAIESAIHYAYWVNEGQTSSKQVDHGFVLPPEVRDALETLLDQGASIPSSLYLVLGRTLPWLVTLDEQWCRDNLGRIFPRSKRRRDQRRAAWNTYLKFHEPDPRMLKLLRTEFRYSVNMLDTPGSTQGPFGDAAEDLAQHLMIYYWWGSISQRPDNNLVKQFFRMASDKQRASAIKFVGWSFWRTEEQAPDDVIAHLVKLWDWRMSIIRSAANVDEFREELAEFGWWVRSKKFPKEWSLTNIQQIIRMIGWFPMVDDVLEVLIEDQDAELATLLDCVGRILDSASEWERWKLNSLVKPARVILEKALQDDRTHGHAVELVNKYGAKGFIKEFRPLADRYGSHQ